MDIINDCQSCGMPMRECDGVYATNQDGSLNKEYCIYCYKDGKFVDDMSMEEMMAFCVPLVLKAHPEMKEEEVRLQMQQYFPKLKRWQSS